MAEEVAQKNTLLFLCLARDCETNLPRFFQFMDDLHAAGIPNRALIGENGSRDRTRQMLLDASSRGITHLDTAAMAASSRRLQRMAIGRELLLDAAQLEKVPAPFICVADLDDVMQEPPCIESIHKALHRLEESKDLFAIGATSRPFYYDLLSLRAKGYDFSTLDAEIADAKRKPLSYYRFHQRRIYQHQRAFRTESPIVCESSFNGFCLYLASEYALGSYRGPCEDRACEHVTMNLSIARATGRHMMIASDLHVRTPPDHAPVGLVKFWLDRLRSAATARMR